MFDFTGADGRSWSYDPGPLTAVEDFHGFPTGGSQAVGVIRCLSAMARKSMPALDGAGAPAQLRRRDSCVIMLAHSAYCRAVIVTLIRRPEWFCFEALGGDFSRAR